MHLRVNKDDDMKKVKYIILGEKRNGKFYKSEQYTLDEFKALLKDTKYEYGLKKHNFLERLFGIKKKHQKMIDILDMQQDEMILNIIIHINNIINKDKKGKRRK